MTALSTGGKTGVTVQEASSGVVRVYFGLYRPTLTFKALVVAASVGILAPSAASAQVRRRAPEPPPAPAEPIREIADETAKCGFAFHTSLERLRGGDVRQLSDIDRLARQQDPALSGRWLYWTKTSKGAAAPKPERVCAQNVTRNGRARCTEWETKPVDPVKLALFASAPTADELTVLRALDAFVGEKGATLEFGSNGRQHATLQRVAVELQAYTSQPRHPALCNGVPEMMEFKAGKLEGLKKRIDDVGAIAAKARTQELKRVTAARELRATDAKLTAGGEPATAPTPGPVLPPLPADMAATALVVAALEGTVPADKIAQLRSESSALRALQRARDLVAPDATPDMTPAVRTSITSALRMIEAASYAEVQVARVQRFDRLFLGLISQIREAHRATCTCGD